MKGFLKVTRYARAAKFWLVLLLALVAYFGLGTGEARAQATGDCRYTQDQCNPAQALASCKAWAQATLGTPVSGGVRDFIYMDCEPTPGSGGAQGGFGAIVCRGNGSGGCRTGSTSMTFVYTVGCPSGSEWNAASGQCQCSPGYTMRAGGQCKSCESLNSEPGFGNQTVARPFKERCLGGCTFRAKPNASTCMLIGGAGAGTQHCSGEWEFTGASCSVGGPGDPLPVESPLPGEPGNPKPKQECAPAGSGQTVCIKENGDHCYSASTGRQICWKPGQAGEQGDGPVAQVRKPGTDTPLPSNMQTHAGDALTSQGEPMTVTTVVNGQLTITTTTQNYRTENGTDAKPDSNGQPGDGQDEEQRDGEASGGEDCGSKPVVSDPALEMVATQAWATRCAVEAGNAASVTGDIGDCKSPFTVEGTNANAIKLRAMRRQICGPEEAAEAAEGERETQSATVEGDIDAMEAEFSSAFGDGEGEGGLSLTRFGGSAACPQLSIALPGGNEFSLPPSFCTFGAALRLLFLAIATIWALRIIGSE